MGFGSYDESEQEAQTVDADFDSGDDGVDGPEDAHDGELTFDNGASNGELLDRLQDIK